MAVKLAAEDGTIPSYLLVQKQMRDVILLQETTINRLHQDVSRRDVNYQGISLLLPLSTTVRSLAPPKGQPTYTRLGR